MAVETTKFAMHVPEWRYVAGMYPKSGMPVSPTEYRPEMENYVFCPECYAPLYRSPKLREHSSVGKGAFFAHKRSIHPPCSIRTKPTEGRRYESEEEAGKAIEDGRLVILSSFMQMRPQGPDQEAGQYDQGPVEDIDGPLAKVPISRHRGESFLLPSRITTVAGLCRKFDENYYKYFVMPDAQYAVVLKNLLKDINDVVGPDSTPRLYFATIKFYSRFFNSPKWKTGLEHSAPGVGDFCIKQNGSMMAEKGISEESVGKIVLMYGKVTINGSGLCVENLAYGEFALLPKQYEYLLK